MSTEDKKNNVVGIGHNTNQYSKEQYAKLVNSLHRAHKFAQQEMYKVRRLFDEAFTKYPNSNSHEPKLKEFEIHEKRHDADKIARKFRIHTFEHIDFVEKKAKAESIKLELPTKEDEESND